MNGLVRVGTLRGQVKITGREGSCSHSGDCASSGGTPHLGRSRTQQPSKS